MIITNASKIMVKGNLNKMFYWFCVRKNPLLIKYIFINAFYYICSIILNNRNYYLKRKFRFYKNINNLDKTILNFKKRIRTTNYFDINPDYIIEEIPCVLLKKLFSKNKIIGLEFDKKNNVDFDKYANEIKQLRNIEKAYINKKISNIPIASQRKFLVKEKKIKIFNKHHDFSVLINIFILFLLANAITVMSFFFAWANFDIIFFKPFFEIRLYLMNFIPILLFLVGLYFTTGRVYVSFSIVFLMVLLLGISNQTKLFYRDDVVKFEDLLIIKEAFIMSQRYSIIIKKYTVFFILCFIPCIFVLKYKFKTLKTKWYVKLISFVILVLTCFVGYNKFYSNSELYDELGDKSLINIWISTRQSQIRGLIYPFIYTIKDCTNSKPAGYSEEKAISILGNYSYEDIPGDKKVNVIAIMFEAFNDFSKFKEVSFTKDIYKKYHMIEKESISGNLITQIFGGGTIVTERSFITGYYNFPTFRKTTNSYVWYFKEQGYNTDAMHPVYGAFYNRTSVNQNLGYDNYFNYDNRYNLVQKGIMWDDHYFINDIISQYKINKSTNKPYFNFSVTYQNHGPYVSESYSNKPYYIKKGNMSDEGFNTINEYFKGIYDTVDAMYNLIEYFKKESEPTIIVLFGDHNPYLGENQLAYNELGINMDISTIEGFKNYYSVPYIIYGNSSAKKMFNKSFTGKGEEISPIFLMNEIFDYLGLKGNQYMQYLHDLKKNKKVINPIYKKVDGGYIKSEDVDDSEFEIVNYYVANNFKYNK